MSSADNPGTMLASAVDAEIAKFRALQQELQNLRQDLGTVMGQETENEMVLLELEQLSTGDDDNDNANGGGSTAKIYKLLGPVLVPQDLTESVQTVHKRLEFIRAEKQRLERRVTDTETAGNSLAARIQSMQAGLQRTTADAVRAIAQEHGGTTAA